MLTAPAKASAAPACGLSHTWTESFWPAATVPVAWVRLVNGTALPGTRATAGVGEALANPLAPTIVVPMIAAVAPVAAISDLVLDIAPLSVLWLCPVREARYGHSRACVYPQETLRKVSNTKP